LWISNQYLPVH